MTGEAEAWSDRGSRGVGRGSEAQPLSAPLRDASLVGGVAHSHFGGRGFESHSVHQAEEAQVF